MIGLLATLLTLPIQDPVYDRPDQPLAPWQRDRRDLLYGFSNMYQPCVIQVPDKAFPYRMWFFGWATGVGNAGHSGVDAIFTARSSDLQTWEVYAGDNKWDRQMKPEKWSPVITAGNKPYDEVHNGDPSVVLKDGRYYMAFTASGSHKKVKFHPDEMLDCVMGATSDDGITWKKTDQPLLIEPPAMQDPKTDEAWTGQYCRPSLMWDDGRWRLWFDYWHPEKGVGYCLGYAESKAEFDAKTGFEVIAAGSRPLIRNWLNPTVVKVGGEYRCYGDALSLRRSQLYPPDTQPLRQLAICEAISTDGIVWRVKGFLPPESDVPSAHIPQASVLTLEGKSWLYLFYASQRGGDPYDYRYDRIRAMRQPLNPASTTAP